MSSTHLGALRQQLHALGDAWDEQGHLLEHGLVLWKRGRGVDGLGHLLLLLRCVMVPVLLLLFLFLLLLLLVLLHGRHGRKHRREALVQLPPVDEPRPVGMGARSVLRRSWSEREASARATALPVRSHELLGVLLDEVVREGVDGGGRLHAAPQQAVALRQR